jgi:hypothetical protein
MQVLKPMGLCTILAYVGHEEGRLEYEALQQMLPKLPTEHWITTECTMLNRPTSPRLFSIWKRPPRSNVGDTVEV